MFGCPTYICCCAFSLEASLSLKGSSCETVSGLARFPTIAAPVPDARSPDGETPDECDATLDKFFFDIRSLPPIEESRLVDMEPRVETESFETSFSGIFCCTSGFSNPTTDCLVSLVALKRWRFVEKLSFFKLPPVATLDAGFPIGPLETPLMLLVFRTPIEEDEVLWGINPPADVTTPDLSIIIRPSAPGTPSGVEWSP